LPVTGQGIQGRLLALGSRPTPTRRAATSHRWISRSSQRHRWRLLNNRHSIIRPLRQTIRPLKAILPKRLRIPATAATTCRWTIRVIRPTKVTIPQPTKRRSKRLNHRRRCRNTASRRVPATVITGLPATGLTPIAAITGYQVRGYWCRGWMRSGRRLTGTGKAGIIAGMGATGVRTSAFTAESITGSAIRGAVIMARTGNRADSITTERSPTWISTLFTMFITTRCRKTTTAGSVTTAVAAVLVHGQRLRKWLLSATPGRPLLQPRFSTSVRQRPIVRNLRQQGAGNQRPSWRERLCKQVTERRLRNLRRQRSGRRGATRLRFPRQEDRMNRRIR
jgi:hypothetical protein